MFNQTGSRSSVPSESGRPAGVAPAKRSAMLSLAAWCIAHRRRVVLGWLAVAVLATSISGAVGHRFTTDYTLPGTESQHASDLLTREFSRQSGDIDTIVFHVTRGTIDS